ncbi:MAG TPA: JAB domain-containing protein [Chitinophagales bacterium]|nr:JAB domain-containing protein [Chitinophagales bacterium]
MKKLKSLFTVSGLALEDTPTYKQINSGNAALSDAELIATILGKRDMIKNLETARIMLKAANNNLRVIARNGYDFVSQYFSPSNTSQILAALETGNRKANSEIRMTRVINSREIYEYMQPLLCDLAHEEFWVIYLNKAMKVVDRVNVSKGGVGGTVVDIKIILKAAITNLAQSIVFVHNHPSGNIMPSDADVKITKKAKDAATTLEIDLLDHIIVSGTANEYYSFADDGTI